MSRTVASADVYHAIADPTRRRMLELLVGREWPVGDLVELFAISQPSVSEHLRVLREAGLVSARRLGRRRLYALQAARLREVAVWAMFFARAGDTGERLSDEPADRAAERSRGD